MMQWGQPLKGDLPHPRAAHKLALSYFGQLLCYEMSINHPGI